MKGLQSMFIELIFKSSHSGSAQARRCKTMLTMPEDADNDNYVTMLDYVRHIVFSLASCFCALPGML